MYEQLYRSLYRVRRVEEEIARIYPTDKLKSPVHLSIGQEAVSVAVCEALKPQDVVFGTYRSHAMYLAKGGDLPGMLAEMYGKATGCTRGKGGSMHLVDTDAGVMGTSAVVGTTIANAVGFAYAMKLQRKPVVTAVFFGDGATEEGVFYESLNFAALKKLPVVFVCENNGYAIHTHQSKRQAVTDIARRAAGFGVESHQIKNNDCLKLHELASRTVDAMRGATEPMPCFIEAQTYRWKEHVGPNEDWALGYRSQSECQPWVETDQVKVVASHVPAEIRRIIEREVDAEVANAVAFAEASPFPEVAELFTHIYHEPTSTAPLASPVRRAA